MTHLAEFYPVFDVSRFLSYPVFCGILYFIPHFIYIPEYSRPMGFIFECATCDLPAEPP
jgi:hypothetical protein